MSRRRLRRKTEKAKRHAQPLDRAPAPPLEIVRTASRVERLAYTRTQAAAALGISRSTFDRRVLPLVETVKMPWGTQLIPVDELKRVIAEQRQAARARARPLATPGRRPTIAPSIVDRIRAAHAAGSSLGQIARDLNADQVPTAHGGEQWWPSTVRALLCRSPSVTPHDAHVHAPADSGGRTARPRSAWFRACLNQSGWHDASAAAPLGRCLLGRQRPSRHSGYVRFDVQRASPNAPKARRLREEHIRRLLCSTSTCSTLSSS